jgi:uncharacterized protein (DUF1501 family)
MDRRKFIRNISYTGAGAMMLGGIPVKLLASDKAFKMAAAAGDNENVLIFIQLHGGNDALNTLVPVSQYNEYYNLRPNIALPDKNTRRFINVDTGISEELQVGLHPDMTGFKALYDEGKAVIVQNVSYPDMNGSHFRGRDIVMSGGGPYDNYSSGWMGRFLDEEYPGYPDAYPNNTMPDPIGIELGGALSLAFHRDDGIPIGLAINSPDAFYQLINSVGVEPPILFPDSHARDELRYIMDFEKKSNQYAGRLKEVYDAGSNSSVEYPLTYPFAAPKGSINNPLSPQLKLIARLLAGGIKTRIFLCRIGGFDTHGNQVETYDSTLGAHAALLYHISSAVKAFYDDLAILGHDNKVLAMTFTEFGRRASSNASYGTDHGTSTPVFLFGTGLNAGIYGQNPDLNNLSGGNLIYNIDYRQIYSTVVQDWFGASNEAMAATHFDSWVDQKLPLISTTGIKQGAYMNNRSKLIVSPNPVYAEFNVKFFIKSNSDFTLTIFNSEGKEVSGKSGFGSFGTNKVKLDASNLPGGNYVVQVRTQTETLTERIIKR